MPTVNAVNGEGPSFIESFSVAVNCTAAKLKVFSVVYSPDAALVCFPPGVDMNRSELTNAILIEVKFSRRLRN